MKSKNKNKTYLKAVRYYEEGKFDEAIKLCDECISENLKNSSALNLKGLILYIKGDLENARNQWKINSDQNDNSLAKNYLFDSVKDMDRYKIFMEAKRDIKDIKIDEAIRKLMLCRESDYNSINVNLALSDCYFKKGDYSNSSAYLKKVLELDSNNVSAKKIAKNLQEYGDIKITTNSAGKGYIKYVISGALVVCLCVVAGFTVKAVKSNIDSKKNKVEDVNITVENTEEDNENTENQASEEKKVKEKGNDSVDKGENKVENKINFSELSNLINEKNYDKVYDELQKITQPDKLTGQEKTIYYNGKQLLEDKGAEYFYETGYELYSNKAYEQANNEFVKGYTYGKNSYLYPHLIFYTAASYEALGNVNEAIKYYEQYYNEFSNSDYIEEVTYKLAILNKSVNIDLAKKYAEELREKYPSSMYNNNVISNLIDSVN
ncbi:TolA-binding protein [Clostridium sp. DSM 8431]|uniref:tetratricopeptide repeat protein n=1 Tax=Clostridium sp. DSM 8431 TaxID=1761781 RepID=UPI0008F2D919|nr:tetratricopeptide repeat protein [Clostridium sp. DSM 8431]SFU30272.1 TolA-binding protein [Clostridium sp. DSM 8431]